MQCICPLHMPIETTTSLCNINDRSRTEMYQSIQIYFWSFSNFAKCVAYHPSASLYFRSPHFMYEQRQWVTDPADHSKLASKPSLGPPVALFILTTGDLKQNINCFQTLVYRLNLIGYGLFAHKINNTSAVFSQISMKLSTILRCFMKFSLKVY